MKRLILLGALAPAWLGAQAAAGSSVHPQVRADVVVPRSGVIAELGAGLQVPAGSYARIDVIPAVGAHFTQSGSAATGRLDVAVRFLLDPFHQQRWGLSVGGGLGVREEQHTRGRALLLAVIDLEGPRRPSGYSPAFQVGLGGGVRIGGALRWGAGQRR